MNCDTTLFFPDTILDKKTAKKLLLFFDSIYLYQPTEAETGPEDESFPADELIRKYAPAPLGDDLLKFQNMIKDLTGHENEYYGGYLSSLSRDHLIDWNEASVYALISNFSRTDGHTAKSPAATESNEEMWRARLLLKLAESHNHADKEISEGLARIESRRTDIMESLRGKDDSSEKTALEDATALCNEIPDNISFTMQDISVPSHSPIRKEYLIKAWGRLYIADQNIKERPLILTTGLINAMPLFDALEYHFKKAPVKLFSITLPDSGQAEDAEYMSLRSSFRSIAGKCIKEITQVLREITQGKQTVRTEETAPNAIFPVTDNQEGKDTHPLFEKEVTAWSDAVNSLEQSSAHNDKLSFYLFPDISFYELFQKINGSVETEPLSSSHPHHSIMAVLDSEGN